MYDALGGAAMRYATYLLSGIAEAGSDEPSQQVLNAVSGKLGSLQFSSGKRMNDLMSEILIKVNGTISGGTLSVSDARSLARVFLAISSACTRLCVGSAPLDGSAATKPSTVLDKWTIATAPARIDLAGGWSDTPPICFDGSVGKF